MLRWRLAGAASMIAPALTIFWLDAVANDGRPGIWLLLIAVLFSIGACWELHQIFQSAGMDIGLVATLGSALVAFAVSTFPVWYLPHADHPPSAWGISGWGWVSLGLVAACGVRFCLAMRGFIPRPEALLGLAASIFAIVYLVLPLLFLLHTRLLWDEPCGLWAVGSIVWVVKMSDSGAYFCGRYFGKRPLAPRLSPKKTIEGALGGIVGAALSSVLFFQVANRLFATTTMVEHSLVRMVGYGVAIALAGILGDLSESLIKRHAGRKDSASWIPGLGGTLDVFDSIQFAAPVGYVFWVTGLVGGL